MAKEKSKIEKNETTEKKENMKCDDKNCHVHGKLKTRGRIFEGTVIKKFHKRVVVEFERMIYVRKYERYMKGKTKIHAHLPDCMADNIHTGDLIREIECRTLRKKIQFAVTDKKKREENELNFL